MFETEFVHVNFDFQGGGGGAPPPAYYGGGQQDPRAYGQAQDSRYKINENIKAIE